MKNIFTLFIALFITMSISAQKNEFTVKADSNAGVFEFETETVDYGTIEQHTDGKREFVFKNVGNSPIIISKAKGSCGCTVPTVPKRPIMPGETAKIGVKYATNRLGKISKSITIYSNASEKTKVIRIAGNVIKAKKAENLETPKPMMSAN